MHRTLHWLLTILLALAGLWFLLLAVATNNLGPLERVIVFVVAAGMFLWVIRLNSHDA
jgi:4-hydroxybenzoate polyprenyltransferase